MARPRTRLKRHNIRVTQFFMKRATGTRRKGQLVSKDYAKRHPGLVQSRKTYRSRLTGWNIKKERIRKDQRAQRKLELLYSRLFEGTDIAKTAKQKKAAMELFEQLRVLSGPQITSMLAQSPDLSNFLAWALTHADMLGMSDEEREAFQAGV